MRTKVLICAAALAAASAFTSMAQSVYSLNVVGYINLPLVEGFNMVANQLDVDGTGTNNTISGVFGTNLPVGSAVYTWAGAGYNPAASFSIPRGGTVASWSAQGALSLNPGQGAFVQIPAGAFGGATQNVTTVGQVLQNALVNAYIPASGGYSLLSSMVPLQGTISSLGYVAVVGDQVFTYDTSLKPPGFDPAFNYSIPRGGTTPVWTPNEPSINVGQGFILNTKAGTVWSNYFTVAP
jgi:hypothetical protein